MKDMKIEYNDGKLIELSIDGVSFNYATAITFNHKPGETLPTVTLSLPIGIGGRLVSTCTSRQQLRSIDK